MSRRTLIQATLLVLAVWAIQHYWPWSSIRHGAGIAAAPSDPVQNLAEPYRVGQVAGYDLTAVADYSITARVLSTRRYRYEPARELAPIDIAVGWGAMSDDAVLDQLDISQSFRFYFYEWQGQPPLPPREISAHSANMHIIPANREVAKAVFGLRRGEVVRMRGELVNARNATGNTWATSLTRTDVGAGACELFYVESIERDTAPKSKPAPALARR